MIVARHVGTHSDPHHAHMEVARCGGVARRQAKQALVVAGQRWRRHARTAAASHVSAAPIGERGLPPAQAVYVVLFGDLFAVGLAIPDTLEAADAMRRRHERERDCCLRNCCSVPWTDRALCSAPKSEGTTSRYDLVCPPGPGKHFTYVLPVRFCGGYNCCVRFRVMARRAAGAESMSGQRSGPSWESGTGAWGDGGSLRAGCYRAAGLVLRSDGSSVEFERLDGATRMFREKNSSLG